MKDDAYETLAAEIIAYAVRDYRHIMKKFMRASPKEKTTLLYEKRQIEKFLLSEKFNFTDISGKDLLELAKNADIQIPHT